MITMAEKSGNLDRVMITTGEYFEKEGVQSLQQALKLLEPILDRLHGWSSCVGYSVCNASNDGCELRCPLGSQQHRYL
jgi:hypothetical protein